jgi:ubiquinone/menaquinone biosynthesis C-methylase UbiE/uncharacterized protein YbaR (Trm112 family)
MHLDLLQQLCCPSCGNSPLDVGTERASDDRVESGLLWCSQCGRGWPVQDGIARIMPDALRSMSERARVEAYRDSVGSRVIDRALAHFPTDDAVTSGTGTDAATRDKLQEIGTRDQESVIYDDLFPDSKYRRELEAYRELFQPAVGAHVLELGAGTGRVTRHIVDHDIRLVCVDFSFESLVHLRDHLPEEARARVDLIQADVCELPFADASFDAVLSFGLVCNLPGAGMRDRFLASAMRTLRGGGTFVLATYHWCALKWLRGVLGLAQTGRKEGHRRSDGVYYYNHGAAEMREWLEPYLEVDTLRGLDHRLPLLHQISPSFSAWMDGVLEWMPGSLPLVARELVVRGHRRSDGAE